MQFTQGILFDHFALVAGIPELHGNVTIKKTVLGRPPTPGHCIDRRQKHNCSLPGTRFIYLTWGFSLRDRLPKKIGENTSKLIL